MSIFQFVRIVWAYRALIAIATVVCGVAAVITVQLVQPRYEAESRVMLDIVKPDPVTGQMMATAFVRAYTKTQIQLIKDLQVASLAVEDLGWKDNPERQKAYRERGEQFRNMDFDRWAAEVIMAGADARLIEGSNILEISYSSSSPTLAKSVADALRRAYMEMTLQSRREAARRNAEWYEAQAEKTKAILLQAEGRKADYERETGIILQDKETDLETARLRALASQGSAPVFASAGAGAAPSAAALAVADAELAQASKVLGPNHPQLIQLRQRRELLERQVEQERSASGSASVAAMSAARATSGMLEEQKAKVMSQRDEVERLRLMQSEIDLRREQYSRALARAAELRQEAEIASSGVVALANAVTPRDPVFPQKAPIIGGALLVGMGLGAGLGLLMELIGRRVRGVEDMMAAANAPVLAIVRGERGNRSSWGSRWRIPEFRFGKAAKARVAGA